MGEIHRVAGPRPRIAGPEGSGHSRGRSAEERGGDRHADRPVHGRGGFDLRPHDRPAADRLLRPCGPAATHPRRRGGHHHPLRLRCRAGGLESPARVCRPAQERTSVPHGGRSGLQRRHDTPHGRPGVLQTLLFHRLADPRRLQGGADPPHRLGRRRAAHRRLHVHERRRPAADVPQQFPRPAVVRTRRLGRHLPARPHPGPQPRGAEHGLVVRTDGPRERNHVQT